MPAGALHLLLSVKYAMLIHNHRFHVLRLNTMAGNEGVRDEKEFSASKYWT